MSSTTEEIDPAAVSLLTGAPLAEGNAAGRTRAQQRISLTSKRRKMSRRANLIGICGVSSLCILLLIATTQHRPLPTSMAIVSHNIGGGSGDSGTTGTSAGLFNFAGDRQHPAGSFNSQSTQTMVAYNMTATIADVLSAQRTKIANEMENFQYSRGEAEKLSDMTPETDGTPIRSIIVTTWRSGSTFLGDILNAIPGNYYHYEPLLNFGIKQVRESDEQEEAINNLKNLLYCDYSNMDDYLEYGKSHTYLFEHNERLWTVCKEFPHYCWRPKFLAPFCKLFPIQSMKTVRLRLSTAEELLKENGLNVRIILLVRDPRGTMQSRRHRIWCGGNPDCDDPKLLCGDLVDDYKSAEILLKKYPNRFKALRYEDLSLNPYEITEEVLQFYGLPFDRMVEDFLDTHTKVNIGGVSSTYRDSRSAPFHWKQDLKIEEIKSIQDQCNEAMELWGYRKIDNFSDFQRTFDPIVLPSPFT